MLLLPTKSRVGYRSANYSQTKFCRACKFADLKTSACVRVSGKISFGSVCDLFERDPAKHSLPPRPNSDAYRAERGRRGG
jgi:hypothetical protein